MANSIRRLARTLQHMAKSQRQLRLEDEALRADLEGRAEGLRLLLDYSWGQEVIHQIVLRELLARTYLAWSLQLWGHGVPTVQYEPHRGLFDLSLAEGDPPVEKVLIELKVGADLSDNQRRRQRELSGALGAPRAYILLGTSYFMAAEEPDARNIGVPELSQAILQATREYAGPIIGLARAYSERLQLDAEAWVAGHDPTGTSGLDLTRFYAEIAAAWPVDVRATRVTNRGGPDWILNADAWTKGRRDGWEDASFYWEVVNGRTRFKILWEGDRALRLIARERYRVALERAAVEINEPISRTRAKAGAYMTALELAGDLRQDVLIDGRVDPARARNLYDRATALFRRALEVLPEMSQP